MTDIKFRAWDKKTEKMIFTGFHILGEVMAFHEIEGYISKNMCGAESTLERWKDIVCMPCTGLRDKNGKEIYRDDICVFVDHYNFKEKSMFSVIYNNGAYRKLYIDWDGVRKYPLLYDEIILRHLKVIGNIYENPGLLDDRECI